MPRIIYQRMNFTPKTREIIVRANIIIAELAKEGYSLTLRQLYYQFVARNWLKNKQTEYKRLGQIVSNARRAGMIDWDAIVDRTRFLRSLSTWSDPADIIAGASQSFRLDRWERQPIRPEVWIEKDALVGVFERVCQRNQVGLFSCKGYASDSEVWAGAMRLAEYTEAGQRVVVLHFGDHDPSGLDMTRDIEDRLQLFTGGAPVEVRRLALTMDQIEETGAPPNPAKESDSRFEQYRLEHGSSSWELDALRPNVLAALVDEEVNSLRDQDLWDEAVEEEREGKALLQTTSKRWDPLSRHIGKKYEADVQAALTTLTEE